MKFLKIITGIAAVVLLVMVIASVLLVTFVNPNRFKPLIEKQVMKQTRRQLTIDGDLSWSLFPHVGIKVGHSILGNTSEYKQKTFAEFDHATISVKLLPLLRSEVESSGMMLEGLKLYLIKNANGKTNWQGLMQTSSQTASTTKSEDLKKSAFALTISAVDISNANVFWIDEQNNKKYNIEKFEFHAKNINLQDAFPIKTNFVISSKNPAISGDVSFSAKLQLNASNQQYLLKEAEFTATINDHQINIKGDMDANLNEETLELKNFTSKIDDSKITGEMNVVNLISQPRMTGKMNIDTMTVSNMKITDIQTKMSLENNVFQISSATAKFYQGTITSQAKIYLNEVVPNYAIQAQASNIQAGPLLKDISDPDQKLKFSGTGNITINIITAGADADTMKKSLNGSGRMNFDNGVLEGIDVGYLIDSAYALAKKQSMPNSDTQKTSFSSMTGSFEIHNGIVLNNDLHLDSARFDTNGKGEIDLPNDKINYSLQTLVKKTTDEKDTLQNLFGLPIPISITGNLDKPKIGVDTKVLLEAIAKKQLQKSTEKLGDQLKDKLPGDAGKLLNNLLGR